MGWSLFLLEKELSFYFKERKKAWSAVYMGSEYPQVVIEYEGELSQAAMKAITALFPDFVYVNFHPGAHFDANARIGVIGAI